MEFHINYKAAAKKAGIAAVIIAVLGGAGAWYHHSQEKAMHLQQQARTALVTAQASSRSLTLLDENAIRSITAEAIGQDETAITFKQIALTNAADARDGSKKDKERDKKGGEHRDKREKGQPKDEQRGQEPQGPESRQQPDGNAPADAPAPQGPDAQSPQQAMHAPDFRPVYRVNCNVGDVRYRVEIDAVSGKVIRASV